MRRAVRRAWLALRARRVLDALRDLEVSQWLSTGDVEALQLRKLRPLLAHAGATVPYYRDLFARIGFDPAGMTSIRDLNAIPILERDTLIERFDDLRSERAAARAVVRVTGGSTGRPVRFLVDEHEAATRSAHIDRNLRWLGWDLGDRLAFVWGSDFDSREHRGGLARLRDAVSGVLWIDAFTLGRGELDDVLQRLQDHHPAVLIGYPSSLHLLAERALATGRTLSLRGIQTSAEMLAPRVRDDLQMAFGCRVMDRYGCREAGIIAHECPEGRLHVNAEAVVMECPQGDVVVTTLNNYAMPLIRYRNEDSGEMSGDACACGRGLPLAGSIRGRLSDVIRAPGGRLIHGEFFTHLFYDAPGVRRFQVRQTRRDELQIACVADEAFTPEVMARLESLIHAHGDPAFRIRWMRVAEITAGPSGKFRFTISEVTEEDEPLPGVS